MPNLKKCIIILSIILSIIVGVLIYVVCTNKGEGLNQVAGSTGRDETIYKLEEKIKPVSSRINFYNVQNCINKFYAYTMAIFDTPDSYYKNEELRKKAEKQNMKAVYDILDAEYIKAKNITEENVSQKIPEVKKSVVDITDMYTSEKSDKVSVFIVIGTLREYETNKVSNFQIIAKVDLTNQTFTIIPEDYVREKYKNLSVGSNIEIETPKSIENKINNTYTFKVVSDDRYVLDLFNQYKGELLYNVELAYNRLDTEYKNRRFGSIDKFKTNISNNNKKYKDMKLEGYQKVKTEDYTQYTCIDKNGNYYIFRETTTMKYSVILDTYTLDLPEFLEKYNDNNDEIKVGMNIQKIFDAINDGDYRYVYSKLDNTFKANNFKTEEAFEYYAKTNFYAKNTVKHNKCQKNGEIYVYDITLTDATNSNKKGIEKTIVMQLKEGTDFVMSFNVK